MTQDAPSPVAPAVPPAMTRVGLGCAHIGDLFVRVEEADAQATLEAAWDAGVRYFDTAPWYGHGLSEHRLGTFLRGRDRAEAFVSTKVGRVYAAAPRGTDARVQWLGGLNFAVGYDYGARGFAASLEQSRLRLGTPSVDALIIHDLDRGYHGAAFAGHYADLRASGLAYLRELKEQGEIAAVGMGINAIEEFETMSAEVDVDFFLVAMPYTLLDHSSLHGPMARCLDRGIRVVIGAPFASGLLADPRNPKVQYGYRPATDEIRAKALALEACCARHGVPLAAAALQFPLLHPAVQSVIPGAVSPEQVRANCAAAAHPIPEALWADMKAEGLLDPAAPTGPR